ncbi:glycosyltransferase family 2 protein [Rhodanobacter sp. DHG33]|uniref:glycosyltransferase family 2 protein n=1 Tax=Rhodanobacter sp. DHG33 TaxID=2775921 RepID=UPI0017855034|nr:glycosyltransferase family 2 protein [Rhodanobacter sp. DHG33]MBD8899287.1 glycosyltransferase family 2 protein [Rhodanobacter sp. DHG33]
MLSNIPVHTMVRPLISVIIPTHGPRAALLSRAIKSAIDGLSKEDVEIVLIPNGAGPGWRDICSEYADMCQLVVVEQEQADRNLARAKGLSVARGRYVRFLDDDDYLIPSQAAKQYDALLSEPTLDVCSSPVSIVDSDGVVISTRELPNTNDFVTSILLPSRIPLFLAHVFKTETAKSVGMPLDVKRAEDAVFLLRLCRLHEIRWVSLTHPAAAWYQHQTGRISSHKGFQIGRKIIAAELFELFRHLQSKSQLTSERRNATADALWECVHKGFPRQPWYWSMIGKEVLQTFPNSKPSQLPKMLTLNGHLNPLIGEWGLVPIWQIILAYRALKSTIFKDGYKRIV